MKQRCSSSTIPAPGRDFEAEYADIRSVEAGDTDPTGTTIKIEPAIEIGNIFKLGTRYSEPLNATFLDETGKPQPFEMGCYGIGVTRIAAAAIEQNNDARGIIWPVALAPFTVVICPIGYDRNAEVKAAAATERNLMPPLLEAARAHVSEGELIEGLQAVWGSYTETPVF